MKASHVIASYQAGERNFCKLPLRGANFRGQNLSGADFSGADIRGATFTNATLRGTNFTNAKAGLQKRWVLGQAILTFLLSIVLNFIALSFIATILAILFDPKQGYGPGGAIFGTMVPIFQLFIYSAIARQGLTLRIVDLIKPEERRKASILKKSLSFCRDATLPY